MPVKGNTHSMAIPLRYRGTRIQYLAPCVRLFSLFFRIADHACANHGGVVFGFQRNSIIDFFLDRVR